MTGKTVALSFDKVDLSFDREVQFSEQEASGPMSSSESHDTQDPVLHAEVD